MTKVQKLLVKSILDHIDDMTRRIQNLDNIIDDEMKKYEKAIWHMLKCDVPFKDLGADYYNKFNAEKKTAFHIKKLKELG